MTVKSIMSSEVITIKPKDTVADALIIMCENQVHNIPVSNPKVLKSMPRIAAS